MHKSHQNTARVAARWIASAVSVFRAIPGDPAIWAQTLILALTLLYVKGQMTQLVETNEAPRRTKVYEMIRDYRRTTEPKIEKVRRLGWRSTMSEVTSEGFNREMQEVDANAALKEYFAFTYDLDECMKAEVCDTKRASQFLYDDIKRTYQALEHREKNPTQPEWSKVQYVHYEPSMTGFIHDNCSFLNRAWFYLTL